MARLSWFVLAASGLGACKAPSSATGDAGADAPLAITDATLDDNPRDAAADAGDSADATLVDAATSADGTTLPDASAPPPVWKMSRCIERWPAYVPTELAASLTFRPARLWKIPMDSVPDSPVLLVKDLLIVRSGNRLAMLDLQGNYLRSVLGRYNESLSNSPVATPSGMVFFAGDALYSFDPVKDQPGWVVDLPPHPEPTDAPRAEGPLVDPDGRVYVIAADGRVYSWTADGKPRWSRFIGGSTFMTPLPLRFGVGDALYAYSTTERMGTFMSVETGEPFGTPASPDGESVVVWSAGPRIGLVGRTRSGSIVVTDRCGNLRWSVSDSLDNYPQLLLHDDRLLVFSRPPATSGPIQYTIYNDDGTIFMGPIKAQVGVGLLGADGVLYASECPIRPLEAGSIVAYDREFREMWRLPVETCACREALGADGVLFRSCTSSSYVEAIQTTSPGAATTTWPIFSSRDNRDDHWIGTW